MSKRQVHPLVKDRIKLVMKEFKYDPVEFAALVGASVKAVENVIAGERNPSFTMIENICRLLPVSEEWLFLGKGNKPFTVTEKNLKPYINGSEDLDSHRDIDEAMNRRIRQVRINVGLTQAIFAGNLKVTRDVISALEVGKTAPSANFIKRMAIKYGVNPIWILFGEGPEKYNGKS